MLATSLFMAAPAAATTTVGYTPAPALGSVGAVQTQLMSVEASAAMSEARVSDRSAAAAGDASADMLTWAVILTSLGTAAISLRRRKVRSVTA